MKKTYLIAAIVIVFVLVFAVRIISSEDNWVCVKGEWIKHGNPSSDKPSTGCDPVFKTEEINFNQTGHLIKDNPGLEAGVWYLVYEKPGAPALTVKLSFNNQSVCKYQNNIGVCPDVLLPSSALTNITGVEQNGVVSVVSAISGSSTQ